MLSMSTKISAHKDFLEAFGKLLVCSGIIPNCLNKLFFQFHAFLFIDLLLIKKRLN